MDYKASQNIILIKKTPGSNLTAPECFYFFILQRFCRILCLFEVPCD